MISCDGDVHRDRAQVDLDHPLEDRDQDDQARTARADEPTQSEDDAPLVLLDHLERRGQEIDDEDNQDDEEDQGSNPTHRGYSFLAGCSGAASTIRSSPLTETTRTG